MKIHRFFTTVIYIHIRSVKCQTHIIGQSMNITVFSWLLSFSKLRERESGKQNLGVREKCPKVTYLIFLTGFHWRISLLSRANRLCTVFNAGLKDFGVLRVSVFLSLARSKMAIVCLPRALLKNFLSCLTSAEGKGTPLPFGVPANHLASFFFPLPMSGDPRSLKLRTSAWPTFSPNGHFLTPR